MILHRVISARLRSDPIDAAVTPGERIVFFPTCASLATPDCWHVPIHGWIYQPAELSRLRRASLRIVRRLVHLRYPSADLSTPLFQQRVNAFLADNERNSRVQIQLGSSRFTLAKSRPDGHFEGLLEIPTANVPSLLASTANAIDSPVAAPRWLTFRAVSRAENPQSLGGQVLFVPPKGLSVISDIDDTIKITEVADRRRMLRNTFLREFVSVPEMAELYRHWHDARRAAIHYVSASPWHLYPFLSDFLTAQQFPAGTFHLRDFRLMPHNLPALLRSSRKVKSRHAHALLARYPQRRFILVGDSGESDPALYASLARKFPRQIDNIFIRNVTNESPASTRWKKLCKSLPPSQCHLFAHPSDILS
jgi:hypothetical protein